MLCFKILLCILASSKFIFGEIYLYPIAKKNQNVFYIYQKGLSDLELWRLQLCTSKVEKCLYWRFTPVGLKFLPDDQAFSFIDSGQLKIKNFSDGLPYTVNFNQFVYGIGEVNWLTSQICCFSGKQEKNNGIFIGQIIGELNLLAIHQSSQVDYLSPKILCDKLFWIERNLIDRSSSIKMQFFKITNTACLDILSEPAQIIFDCNYQQVIYLEMLSEHTGFYIEHMPYINNDSDTITFICHKIEFSGTCNRWLSTKLFKFNILKKYLFGEQRLLESFLPFLPRAKKTMLYFADIKRNHNGEYYSSICSFDLISSKISSILSSEPNIILFSPLVNQGQLFYGQVLQEELAKHDN